jgi:hypothetical protein
MKRKLVLVLSLLAVAVLLITACGIPQEDHDAVVAERDTAKTELASLQADLNQLIVSADSVRGHIPSDYGPSCAMNNLFHRGEMIVWRVKVIDPETGNQVPRATSELMADKPEAEALGELAAEATVTIHLSDGQSFPMHFGLHGDVDYFWTFGWEIPADYPTGMINTNITAEWKGKSGEWEPMPIPPSLFTVLE